MTCVDSSIWIAAMRGDSPALSRDLSARLEDDAVAVPIVVRLELLAGAGHRARALLLERLAEVPTLFPSAPTWQRMEAWCFQSADAGQYFSFADLLVAALAAEAKAPVWSSVRAFERMERLGFIRCHRPRR